MISAYLSKSDLSEFPFQMGVKHCMRKSLQTSVHKNREFRGFTNRFADIKKEKREKLVQFINILRRLVCTWSSSVQNISITS